MGEAKNIYFTCLKILVFFSLSLKWSVERNNTYYDEDFCESRLPSASSNIEVVKDERFFAYEKLPGERERKKRGRNKEEGGKREERWMELEIFRNRLRFKGLFMTSSGLFLLCRFADYLVQSGPKKR